MDDIRGEDQFIYLQGTAGTGIALFKVVANVLIVDDDDDIRSLLGALVQMAGHSVREARNGREGLQAVAEVCPDLVLLDVEMPVVTGPEMAYALFIRDCGDEKIPIVLLSGIVGLDEIAALVGTPYFLGKPYAPDALMKMMERAFQEKIAPRPKLEVRL